MDDTEDDARYPQNSYGVYGPSHRPKLPVRNAAYPRHFDDQYCLDDVYDEDEVEEENDEYDNEGNGVIQSNGKRGNDDNQDENESDDNNQSGYSRRIGNADAQRHQKKRKLKSLSSSYEFAPRVETFSGRKPSFGGRNVLADWTEHESFVLLQAWGDRFVQRGRKSLRTHEWQEVSEKVSRESKFERTDTQCRNRLDTLKKKYKKEKMNANSKWVYFKKMDTLMSSSSPQAGILGEMRSSRGNSQSAEGDGDSSFRLLVDSVHKFSDVYKKIENSKREQMVELEKMRMDFHRELEVQKRQILDRARAEIAKIRQGDDEENDVSAENISG